MTHRRIVALLGILLFSGPFAQPQSRNSPAKSILESGDHRVEISYGQPRLRGRDPISILPVGMVWRMGANLATTISSDVALEFSGTLLPEGQYSMWMKRTGHETYELIFNTQAGQSGTVYDPDQNSVSVPMKLRWVTPPYELLTIHLDGGQPEHSLLVAWGGAVLSTKFRMRSNSGSPGHDRDQRWRESPRATSPAETTK